MVSDGERDPLRHIGLDDLRAPIAMLRVISESPTSCSRHARMTSSEAPFSSPAGALQQVRSGIEAKLEEIGERRRLWHRRQPLHRQPGRVFVRSLVASRMEEQVADAAPIASRIDPPS